MIFVMRVKLIWVKLSFCVGFSQYLYMMNLGSTFTAIVIETRKSDMKKFILEIEFWTVSSQFWAVLLPKKSIITHQTRTDANWWSRREKINFHWSWNRLLMSIHPSQKDSVNILVIVFFFKFIILFSDVGPHML